MERIVGARTVAGSGEKTEILVDETSDWRQRMAQAS
jgi:hypothetical protein